MAKSSQQHAAENRQTIVNAASELFREQGFRATSVPEVMRAAGMTHGGFYGHFASKEALAAEAVDGAFDWLEGWVDTIARKNPDDADAAQAELVSSYLTAQHRDSAGIGCPAAALAGDVAREPAGSPVRERFSHGIETVIAQLSDAGRDEQTVLANYATMVGALLLSRATAGSPISDKLLAAARAQLSATA